MIILLFSLLLSQAEAREISSADIVKIFSRDSATDVWREGSGVLLAGKNSSLVVTSFHVAYSSESSGFESYALINEKKIPLHWIASEWAKGLALFQISDLKPDSLLKPVEIETSETKSRNVRALGFPFGQNQVYDLEGEYLGLKNSSLFYDLPELINAIGIDSELGMSGGALTDLSGNFLGILSHQKVSTEGIITLVVPASAVKDWILEVEAGRYKPKFLLQMQNLDGSTLRLQGSGWSLYAEPGNTIRGGNIFLRAAPKNPNLQDIPELIELVNQLDESGRKMRASRGPNETLLLNSFFVLAGFRKANFNFQPNDLKPAYNGVEFLRGVLQTNYDIFFINSGLASNYLNDFWDDYFRSRETDGVLLRQKLGSDLYYAIDQLHKYERERYMMFAGIPHLMAILRPEEIEKILFPPSLAESWANLQSREPQYYVAYHDRMVKALTLLRRANFIYSRK